MVWRTLKEWNERGRYVKKGEKSLLREPNTDLPLFSKKQTSTSKSCDTIEYDGCAYRDEYHCDDWDYEDIY